MPRPADHLPPTTPAAPPDPARAAPARRVAAAWAGALLVLTLLLGVWLRALFLHPGLAGGIPFPHLVHGHSHLAFFGWIVPAFTALLAGRLGDAPGRQRLLRWHAHAVGVASLAALASFLRDGYGGLSIPLSAFHVALWWALLPLAWPLARATPTERRLLRTALVALAVAGAATTLPAVLHARGVTDGWLREVGIRLFLGAFLHGWVGLGAMALLVGALERDRRLRRPAVALAGAALVAAGTLPATLLYVGAAPPASWILPVGRAGAALVALGTLLLAAPALPHRLPPALHLAAAAATLAGTVELLAALGVGAAHLHARPLVVAFLHLHLLGVATPILLATLAPAPHRPVVQLPPLATAAGTGTMLAALAAMGWPWLGTLAAGVGLHPLRLLQLALAGGVVATVALVAWLVSARAAVAGVRPLRAPDPRPARPPVALHSRPTR